MRVSKRRIAIAVVAAALMAGGAQAAGTVIDGVTIVDTRTGALRPGMAIEIADGKIARIARAGSIRPVAGETIVRARGKFVVPGYLDMHAHPLNSPAPEISLPMMVANGITGYRQMAGSDELLAARRAGTLPSPTPAPALLATPGMVLAGPLAGKLDATITEVRKQIGEGADFIKVVDLGPPAFYAALETARGAGLPFVGHLPPTIDVREAARRGMGSVEHLGPNASLLEACSTDEAAIRQSFQKVATGGGRIAFDLPPALLKKLTANPVLLTDPAGFALYQHMLDTYDEQKCRALATELAGTGMWQVPTLIRIKTMDYGDDPAFSGASALRYVPVDDRRSWQEIGKTFTAKIAPSARATLRALFARQMRLMKLFDEAGVKMLAGTDFGGQWIVPGIALHQEFDLLAEAGIPPLHILQMATLNGARFLGREAVMGTVEVGRNADLVLLDADPLVSARNLHRIDAVVRDGLYLSRVTLDGIERDAVIAAASSDASAMPAPSGRK